MKFFVVIASLLIFVTGHSSADWISLSGHPAAKGGKFYVDNDPEKLSYGAKLSHLLDLPVAQLNSYGKPYLSERMLVEYDCVKRRARSLSLVQYPGSMGSGDPVAAFESTSVWVPFSLDPVARTMEETVCGQKVVTTSLFTAHPGWLDLIQTKEFLNWKKSQSSDVQALGGSINESDSIKMINFFKRDQQLIK